MNQRHSPKTEQGGISEEQCHTTLKAAVRGEHGTPCRNQRPARELRDAWRTAAELRRRASPAEGRPKCPVLA
jgi:hypothetical protein